MRMRKATDDHNRPLFLVGHSFGGTIIAKVLHDLKTKKEKPGYERILKAIRCVTFFGSPHSGMTIKHLEPITLEREHESMKRILEDLRKDSEMLRVLRETLQDTQTEISFITCVEQQLTQAQVGKIEDYWILQLTNSNVIERKGRVYRTELSRSRYQFGPSTRCL